MTLKWYCSNHWPAMLVTAGWCIRGSRARHGSWWVLETSVFGYLDVSQRVSSSWSNAIFPRHCIIFKPCPSHRASISALPAIANISDPVPAPLGAPAEACAVSQSHYPQYLLSGKIYVDCCYSRKHLHLAVPLLMAMETHQMSMVTARVTVHGFRLMRLRNKHLTNWKNMSDLSISHAVGGTRPQGLFFDGLNEGWMLRVCA